jgi:hypothetical protein
MDDCGSCSPISRLHRSPGCGQLFWTTGADGAVTGGTGSLSGPLGPQLLANISAATAPAPTVTAMAFFTPNHLFLGFAASGAAAGDPPFPASSFSVIIYTPRIILFSRSLSGYPCFSLPMSRGPDRP